MSIEEQEELKDLLNHKIELMSIKSGTFPYKLFKKYYARKLQKVTDERNKVWLQLRKATRKKYPERFSTQEALK